MELVDVYDSEKRFLRTQERHAPIQEGEYLKVVGIWVIDRTGQILVTKRSPEKKFAPGKWENTGGHLDSGEDPVAAVVRELFEETGVTADEKKVVCLGESKSLGYFGYEFCVYLDFPIENVRLQPGETCNAKWVTLKEFEKMAEEGALAPSVLNHMTYYKDNFYQAIKEAGRA